MTQGKTNVILIEMFFFLFFNLILMHLATQKREISQQDLSDCDDLLLFLFELALRVHENMKEEDEHMEANVVASPTALQHCVDRLQREELLAAHFSRRILFLGQVRQ